jgi:iron transport multicopper oxidase
MLSAFFQNITYVSQKVPTLYTVMTTGEEATNPTVYGKFSNSFVLGHNQIIDIVVNNHGKCLRSSVMSYSDNFTDAGTHPFHLHGHNFQTIARSDEGAGDFESSNSSQNNYPAIPMRRDTVVLNKNGYLVFRFAADNPGVWLFHCHIEWHMSQGLIATMVEAPLEVQRSLSIPQNHFDACKVANVPTAGNAAGNAVNVLDLTGANAPPNPLPAGFTARGIVALVFSCISALVGLAVIAW